MVERADTRCAEVARRQHGAISLRQATGCGVGARSVRRRVESGVWVRLFPGVYGIAGAPSTWRQRLMAATLWGGDGSCASHASAARLWSFPDFHKDVVELTCSRTRGPRGVHLHRPGRLGVGPMTLVDGVPVTTPARTLVDLSRRTPRPRFEAAFHHCVRSRLCTLDTLRSAAERHRGRGAFGAPTFRAALHLYAGEAGAPESPLESRVLRALVDGGVPMPIRQHRVVLPDGRRRRIDFAWPVEKVGLEADSYQWHSSPAAWAADRRRVEELRDAGWVILSATARDLRNRGALVESVSRALADARRP